MRYFILIISLLLMINPISAQEQTPYDIALELILEAEASEAAELDLSWIGLTELPSEIENLSNLRVLNLSFNELSSLPSEIGNLTNLQGFVLSFNRLSSIPPEIGNLSNLSTLALDFNELSSLPSEIGNLTNLCALRLQSNQFQYLPHSLTRLVRLEEESHCRIYLSDNPLISPPAEVIAQGTPAIFDYLENQAWWHFQRLMMSMLGGVAFIVLVILGLRYRQRGQRKPKQKRGEIS